MSNFWLRVHEANNGWKRCPWIGENIGCFRLGGMQPGLMRCRLPAYFRVSRDIKNGWATISDLYYSETMLLCYHGQNEGRPLIWIDHNHVWLDGREMELAYDPTWRTNWTIFAVRRPTEMVA